MIRSRQRLSLLLLLAIVIVACGASGQGKGDGRNDDSSYVPLRYSGPGLSIRRPIYPPLPTPAMGGLDFTSFLRRSLTQASPLSREAFQNGYTVESMWKDELRRQNEYQTLWNIVGAVEAGAVGYLGYRHLARHGLK
jgi:hypothetical protein